MCLKYQFSRSPVEVGPWTLHDRPDGRDWFSSKEWASTFWKKTHADIFYATSYQHTFLFIGLSLFVKYDLDKCMHTVVFN